MKSASLSLALATLALSSAACATSKLDMSTTAPTPDRRVGLRAGAMNAGEATWNLRVVSKTRPSEKFAGVTNSDLSFSGSGMSPFRRRTPLTTRCRAWILPC